MPTNGQQQDDHERRPATAPCPPAAPCSPCRPAGTAASSTVEPKSATPERQHHHVGDGEVAVLEQLARRRSGAPASAPRARTTTSATPATIDEADDERRVEPVVLLPLVEHDLSAPRPTAISAEADVVDAARSFALRGDEVRRIRDHRAAEQQRDDADRDVDEEDPAPGEVVGDEAAQRRSDRRRQHHRHAVDGEGHAALRGREGVGQDRLLAGRRGRRRRAPAGRGRRSASRSDRREAAEERADGEQRRRRSCRSACGRCWRREPAADRQHDRVGDQVRR